MINRRHMLSLLGLAAAVGITTSPATVEAATDWPEKPVRILVSFPPGGSSDLVARLLAKELGEKLGQQFVVENKPGAAGTVAAMALKEAANDGHTFMLSNLTPFSVAPTRFPDTPYDPLTDFTHVSYIGTVHLGLFVRPGAGASDLESFIAMAKDDPDNIDYGTSGVGSWGHIVSVDFTDKTETQLVHIPYKGSGPMRLDFRADVVGAMFDAIPQNLPAVADKEAIPLAVSATERIATLPDTPTFRELGYDIVAENWLGISAPAGLDPKVSAKMDAAMQEVMALPAVDAQFDTWGIIRSTKTTTEFTDYVASQFTDWKPLVMKASDK